MTERHTIPIAKIAHNRLQQRLAPRVLEPASVPFVQSLSPNQAAERQVQNTNRYLRPRTRPNERSSLGAIARKVTTYARNVGEHANIRRTT